MPIPYHARFVVMVGQRDGVNLVFNTPGNEAFVPESNVVFVRNIPRVKTNDDGWADTDPTQGIVTLKEAPEKDDSVMMLYAASDAAAEVTTMSGTIDARDDLAGSLIETDVLVGTIAQAETLSGTLEAQTDLSGVVREIDNIYGTLVEVP